MINNPSTKHILAESLKELAKTKSIDKITITDIVNNCSVGRKTFYYHFKDKYDLISWTVHEKYRETIKHYNSGELTWTESLYQFLSVLYEDRTFYVHAFNQDNSDLFFNSFLNYTIDAMEESLIIRGVCEEINIDTDLQIRFYAHGVTHLTIEWLMKGCNICVDQYAAQIIRCMSPELKELFGVS